MSREVRELLHVVQEWTVRFLAKHLPVLGSDDWWKECVRWKLSVLQERALDERGVTSLDGLDLAALLRVLDKNWRELSFKLALLRDGRTLTNEVHNIRNRLAHEPTAGIELEDQQRDADTIVRYLQLLGADAAVIRAAQDVRDNLRQCIVSGQSLAPIADESPEDIPEADGDDVPPALFEEGEEGVPLSWLRPGATLVDDARDVLDKATYVGIDFGTSTSVVSIATAAGDAGTLKAEPVSIKQLDETGREIEHHLVPTCLAWAGNKLLVGHGAAELKPELVEGRDIWTSFKMRLGVDLGPQYPNTVLPRGKESIVIERPQDAARLFFETIRQAVDDFVQSRGLPSRTYYAVTVPAAFEANQRQDLMSALAESGIPVEESGLLDEPNAAFLSYLVDMERGADGTRFIDSLAQKMRRVLVFDFGAGTCDISVLEVRVDGDRLTSRNLGISKFMALGGDDIDRAIAREVLLPQLCGAEAPADVFTINQLDNLVLPRLKPAAEALKVACSKVAEQRGLTTPDELRQHEMRMVGKALLPIKVQGKTWELKQPSLSLAQFAEIMKPFLAEPAANESQRRANVTSVLEPIDSALEKIGLAHDELDMVLFIGGSCENPLVRQRVKEHVGRFVECIAPRDLRSHVSQGAAIHSFFVHGLGCEPIRPITSEDIYVVTRNGGLERVLPAGTPVPSPDICVTNLIVDRDEQELVELPFCVSGPEKVLGVVTVRPPYPPGYFAAGTKVRISCTITRDKLLKVRVRIGDRSTTARIMNPLANIELSEADRRMLKARQALNEAILAGKGRPASLAVLTYARAAQQAARWREAAEMLEAVERLDPDSDHATDITYSYSKAGDTARTDKWSKIAYERTPDSTTAYNFALSKQQNGDLRGYERLMEESLQLDPENTASLNVYGHYLADKGDARGLKYVSRAFDILHAQLQTDALSIDDHCRLRHIASTLGKQHAVPALPDNKRTLTGAEELFDEANLVRGSQEEILRKEE